MDILRIIKENKISINRKVEGEQSYLNKWKVFGREVDIRYYRGYYPYIGRDENIVPSNILKSIIDPVLNDSRYVHYYRDKNVYGRLFPKEFLPLTFLRRICGHYYDESYNVISNCNLSKRSILQFVLTTEKFIVKPTVDTTSGKGVLLFIKQPEGVYKSQNGDLLSFDFIDSFYKDDFIIQEYLNQHRFTAQFNPTSVNTYRVSTYRSIRNNEVHVLGIILRIGKHGSVVDNIHAGGYIVGIKPNGSLNSYLTDSDGHLINNWNGVDFENSQFVSPHLNLVIDFAKQIATRINHARFLALDIVIDQNENPKLIEYNIGGFGDWAFELNTGSVFGKFTDEIISFCLERQNNLTYCFEY